MHIKIIFLGKTDSNYLQNGLLEYEKRFKHYYKVELLILPDLKNKKLPEKIQKQKEGELILSNIKKGDYIILLDEKGKQKTSVEFASFLQEKLIQSIKYIVFIVGGAYGFSEEIYEKANFKLSLSKMTFSHQMVRLIFLEQLYRSFTILKGEPYHHK